MTDHKETTGKALECERCGLPVATEETPDYCNPRFCWANVDPSGEEGASCSIRHWTKRATEAEARLAHLEEAAELLRLPSVKAETGDVAQRLRQWVRRDQVLSVTTAESGKDSPCEKQSSPSDSSGNVSGVGTTLSSGPASLPVESATTGSTESGAVETTTGEAHKHCERCGANNLAEALCCRNCANPVSHLPLCDRPLSEPAPVAEARSFIQDKGPINEVSVSVAEAPERVTHAEALSALNHCDGIRATVDAVLRDYIAQQEADGNALKYWSTRARELEASGKTKQETAKHNIAELCRVFDEQRAQELARYREWEAASEREAVDLRKALNTLTDRLTDAGRELGKAEGKRLLMEGKLSEAEREAGELRKALGWAREHQADLEQERDNCRNQRDDLRSKLSEAEWKLAEAERELLTLRELEQLVRTDRAIPRQFLSVSLRKLDALRATPPAAQEPTGGELETLLREVAPGIADGMLFCGSDPNPSATPHESFEIVTKPGRMGGRPTIGHTRLTVAQFVGMFQRGMSIDDVRGLYDYVTPEQLRVLKLLADDLAEDGGGCEQFTPKSGEPATTRLYGGKVGEPAKPPAPAIAIQPVSDSAKLMMRTVRVVQRVRDEHPGIETDDEGEMIVAKPAQQESPVATEPASQGPRPETLCVEHRTANCYECWMNGGERKPSDPTPTSTEGPGPFVTRAELISALRLPGAHGPAEYALNQVAARLEREGCGK